MTHTPLLGTWAVCLPCTPPSVRSLTARTAFSLGLHTSLYTYFISLRQFLHTYHLHSLLDGSLPLTTTPALSHFRGVFVHSAHTSHLASLSILHLISWAFYTHCLHFYKLTSSTSFHTPLFPHTPGAHRLSHTETHAGVGWEVTHLMPHGTHFTQGGGMSLHVYTATSLVTLTHRPAGHSISVGWASHALHTLSVFTPPEKEEYSSLSLIGDTLQTFTILHWKATSTSLTTHAFSPPPHTHSGGINPR